MCAFSCDLREECMNCTMLPFDFPDDINSKIVIIRLLFTTFACLTVQEPLATLRCVDFLIPHLKILRV